MDKSVMTGFPRWIGIIHSKVLLNFIYKTQEWFELEPSDLLKPTTVGWVSFGAKGKGGIFLK
jgi:hypothetical protein